MAKQVSQRAEKSAYITEIITDFTGGLEPQEWQISKLKREL